LLDIPGVAEKRWNLSYQQVIHKTDTLAKADLPLAWAAE